MKCLHFLKLFHEDYEDVIHTRCLAHILNLSVKKWLVCDSRSCNISSLKISKPNKRDYAKFSVLLDPKLKNDYFSENNDNEDILASMKLFFDDKYNIQNHVTERGSDPAESSGPSTTSVFYKKCIFINL